MYVKFMKKMRLCEKCFCTASWSTCLSCSCNSSGYDKTTPFVAADQFLLFFYVNSFHFFNI